MRHSVKFVQQQPYRKKSVVGRAERQGQLTCTPTFAFQEAGQILADYSIRRNITACASASYCPCPEVIHANSLSIFSERSGLFIIYFSLIIE